MNPEAVLLLAFGGPDSPEEVRPFLRRVMKGRPFPEEELEAIARHYEAVGGKSPMNELTIKQGELLGAFFKTENLSIPVYVGFRHAVPTLKQTLEKMVRDKVKSARSLIMAPHQSEASWDRYHRALNEASAGIEKAPKIEFAKPFFDHPLFIEAVTERVKETLGDPPPNPLPFFLFTAHSLPVKMAEESTYKEQVNQSSRLVAERFRNSRFGIAYQSRSGDRRVPWLSPDVCDAIRSLSREGEKEVVVVPIGFLCDHVEILYDLDIEAKQAADEAGIRFLRVKTVGDHPSLIRMMAEVLYLVPFHDRI